MTAEKLGTVPARVAVIMAGGSGERFWPISRRHHPKQLLKLAHPDKSMLAQAVERIEPLVGREHVWVATAPHLVEPVRNSLPVLDPGNVLGEPHKRNTSGCLIWATANLLARYGEAALASSIAVLTADQRVHPDEGFRATVLAALETAEASGALATIGIKPTRPETGYGYIQMTEVLEERHECAVRGVSAFREKPDLATAEDYLASGEYVWNSGTFFWRVDAFLAALKFAQPEMESAVHDIAAMLKEGRDAGARFAELPNLSIDYALMERAPHVRVVEAAFDWDDIGAWDALDRTLPADADGNVQMGDVVSVDTQNCVVMNDNRDVVICLLGVSDLTVVVTHDAVLVCPKERAQEVKRVVEKLNAAGINRT